MRILIVEDEKVAARGLERMIQEILGKEISSIKCQATLDMSKLALIETPIDLLFLDLNLYGQNGFELLQEAIAYSFHTIVVSANVDMALQAFEYGVLDFVPKPVTIERLEKAILRIKEVKFSGKCAKYLPIRKEHAVSLIALEEVSYFQGDSNYVEIHLKQGETELHRQTLDALEKIVPPQFSRIHRSYLVDMRDVQGVHSLGGGKYQAELVQGGFLPLSRNYYKKFKESL